MPYVSITLCSPNDKSNCTTIDNILLDTGSTGLRIFAQPINAAALSNLNLTQQMTTGNTANGPIFECFAFADKSIWGPIKYAALKIGEKTVRNLAIQVIAEPNFTSVPEACKGKLETDPAFFRANGILGVSLFRNDCGAHCTNANPSPQYFACDPNGRNCAVTTQPLANQVQNPVTLFDSDNNGFIVTLDPIPNRGAASAKGTLTFGIDTRNNNVSKNTNTILAGNNPNSAAYGFFTTTVNGINFPGGFLDTGVNAYRFNLPDFNPLCAIYTGFYCPSNTTEFTATISGTSGSTPPAIVNFNIANTEILFSHPKNVAFNNLGGIGIGPNNNLIIFAWGLPFFFGKSVYFAIDGGTTNKGNGPYVGW
jgi:hypothetical protein